MDKIQNPKVEAVLVSKMKSNFLSKMNKVEILTLDGQAVVGGEKSEDGEFVAVYGEELKVMWARNVIKETEVSPIYQHKPAYVVRVYVGLAVPDNTTVLAYKYDDKYWVVEKQSDGTVVTHTTFLETILTLFPDAAQARYRV